MMLNILDPFYDPSYVNIEKRKSIFITAKNSFIARNILEQLDYDFTATTHKELDLTDAEAVNKFFKDKYFDVVIHTACIGGRRDGEDSVEIFDDNIEMFLNLFNNRNHWLKLINFGSGADQLNTYYGGAKELIGGIIKKSEDMINLRLFGVWGRYEKPDRFPAYCLNHDEVVIEEDKKMRYIHVDDLVTIVGDIIDYWPENTREMILGTPIKLSKFAKQLNPNIKVIIEGKGEDYI